VFNREALGASGGEVIVCESLIDALTFWVHGLRKRDRDLGADGFTEEHHAVLRQAGVGRVLIALDRDDAGDHGAARLVERLGGEGVECFRVLFGFEQDANSFACQVADPPGELALLLRNAVWMGAGAAPSRPAPVEAQDAAPSVLLEQPGGEEKDSATPPQDSVAPQEGTVPAREAVQDGEAGAQAPVNRVGGWEGDPPLPAADVAAALPPAPSLPARAAGPLVELSGDELRVQVDGRRWRVRGLGKASSFEALRVNVLVAREHPARGEVFHVDSLDLYSARARGTGRRGAGVGRGAARA
jgi:DNA primase